MVTMFKRLNKQGFLKIWKFGVSTKTTQRIHQHSCFFIPILVDLVVNKREELELRATSLLSRIFQDILKTSLATDLQLKKQNKTTTTPQSGVVSFQIYYHLWHQVGGLSLIPNGQPVGDNLKVSTTGSSWLLGCDWESFSCRAQRWMIKLKASWGNWPTFTINNQLNVGSYTIHGSYGIYL